MFSRIRDDRSVFEQVRVNREARTIEWPGDLDLDPDVLYGRAEPASGVSVERRTVTEPAAARSDLRHLFPAANRARLSTELCGLVLSTYSPRHLRTG